MSDFLDLVLRRESCREFNDEPASKEDLLKCIEAGQMAPSAMNAQPWFFYVVVNDKIRTELVKAIQSFNSKAGAIIVIVEEKPCLAVKYINKFKVQDYTQIDIGIVASHICLAATELGLATCMLGLFDEEKIKKVLNISPAKRIRLLISVGYASNKEPRKKKRKRIDEILNYIE
jgi:nitroreductase